MFSFLPGTLDEARLDRRKIQIKTNLPVYITMSTIPSRINNTMRIIKNFLDNVSGIEKVILNVPYRYNRWPNLKIDIPDIVNDNRLYVNRCEDYGPLTKFMPTLNLIPPESILIVCDDMCYKLDAFKDIAEIQEKRPYESFSFYVYEYGDSRVRVPQGADLISMYTANAMDFYDWFTLLKRKLGIKSYFETPCFFVDDQVIGWYFQYKNIPMVQVEAKHRNIYIKDCDKGPEHDNLNRQKGKNSRDNTMTGCHADLSKIFPL